MVSQALLQYIKQQMEAGVGEENIRNILSAQGWQSSDIDEAFIKLGYKQASSQVTPVLAQQSQPVSEIKEIKKPFNKRFFVIGIAIALGVFVIGGGVWAYTYFQSPEMIMNRMTGKISQIKTAEYSAELRSEVNYNSVKNSLLDTGKAFLGTTNSSTDQSMVVSGKVDGVFDIADITRPKQSNTITIEATGLIPFIAQFEMRNIDNIFYIRLNSAPDFLASLKNQWVKINLEDLKRQFNVNSSGTVNTQLSDDQVKKIREIVLKHKIFKITEVLPNEEIESVSSYHYKFKLQEDEILTAMNEILSVYSSSSDEYSKFLNSTSSHEILGELPVGEIWIGKNDLLPRRLSLVSDTKDHSVKVSVDAIFRNFNKPVQVEIPQNTKGLEELFKNFMTNLETSTSSKRLIPPVTTTGGGDSGQGKDFKQITNDLRQVQIALELYYNKNLFYPTKIMNWKDLQLKLINSGIRINYVPQGPSSLETYYYFSEDGNSYILGANILGVKLKDITNNGNFRGKVPLGGMDFDCTSPLMYCITL